ncbi:MAG: M64 family metallopeptidase [Candidatus Krumholzibacteriia bacterium]
MLHRRSTFAILLLAAAALARAGTVAEFDARFHDETLRVDYHHGGDADQEEISLDMVYRQGAWAGSRTRLVDDLDLGRYYVHLYDAATGELLYSRGFDSYFGEYQTTGPAAEGVWRTFHESALVPCPRQPCEVALSARGEDLGLHEIFRVRLDPDAVTIRREPLDADVTVVVGHEGGDPHRCVDVVILGEGYTRDDADRFAADVRHFTGVMLGHEPYRSLADRFNIRGVLKVSQDRGCDEPTRGVFARTPLGCTFNSLGSERYLLTEDNRAVRDLAAHVPYDALYVMVNTDRYGGGGIYNAFNTFTSANQWSDYVFLHEFGHHFAGLADEYYTSQIAYGDFYPRDHEPREPNITRLADPARCKWGDLVTPGTPLPTPWEKAGYDELDTAYQTERADLNTRIGELMRTGGDPDEIARLKQAGEDLSRTHQEEADRYLAASRFAGRVGAYEGAGYCSEGMYRAELDCIMFSKGIKPFCAACSRHLVRVIERYGE